MEKHSSLFGPFVNCGCKKFYNNGARGWCKDSYGVFCMIYNAFNGNEEKVGVENHENKQHLTKARILNLNVSLRLNKGTYFWKIKHLI
jgi:hypothetical protein